MKSKTWLRLFYAAAIAAVLTIGTFAQTRTNQIYRPCASTTTPASVRISTAGAITLNPCSGQGTTFGSSALYLPNDSIIYMNAVPLLYLSTGTGSVGLNMNNSASQTRIGGTVYFTNSLFTYIDGASGKIGFDQTRTTGGTTGAQTINKPSGSVNFAAAASSLVVTNSLVTTSSIVLATIQTNDATAIIKNVVPAAGSFTITLNAAATAETRVGFLVIN